MTVSPNRPQDGNPQRIVGGSGVEPNDRSRVASLPPTLFKLPNLGAVSPPANPAVATSSVDPAFASELPTQAGSGQEASGGIVNRGTSLGESVSPPGSAESTPSRWNLDSRLSQPSADPIGADAPAPSTHLQSEFPVRNSTDSTSPAVSSPEDSSARPIQPSAATTGSIPRPIITDAPAGRSWMESLGSHGVVIVLLLVVVAAALLTGQGEEDPTAKSLSTQSELLDFDELNVDLPLPAHGSDVTLAESSPAVSQPAVAAESNSASASEAAVASTPAATGIEKLEPAVQTQPPLAAAEVSPTDSQTAPVATLEAPQGGTSSGLDHEFNQGFLSNGVKTNEFVVPSSGVDAMTAGNRVNSEDADSALPTLEELAGVQEQSVQAAEPTVAAPARLLTKTPVGILDWSKYLPALDSAVEPDAGTSSFSN